MADSTVPSTIVTSFLRNDGGGGQGGGDSDAKVGMLIVAIVLLFLFCLVLLRYGCNILIDVCILRDGESLMRTVSELRRWFCPCWHPRTEPTSGGIGGTGGIAIETTTINNSDGRVATMETLLSGLTSKQKQKLIASIVPCKVSSPPQKRTRRDDGAMN
jgi:hypothetical protein